MLIDIIVLAAVGFLIAGGIGAAIGVLAAVAYYIFKR